MSLHKIIRQSFHDFWLCLRDTSSYHSIASTCAAIKDSIHAEDALEPETLIAAQDYVSQVSTVTSDILAIQKSSEIIANDHMADIVRILDDHMGQLAITDVKTISAKTIHPAYIKPSYEWLLSNLHNPYPSKLVKKEISRQSNCSVKDIDAWFIDVRKRIGWNRIRKVFFQNKQEKIIAAASDVFKPQSHAFTDDLSVSLASEVVNHDTYRSEFIVMAQVAKSLYARRYPDMVASKINEMPGAGSSQNTRISSPIGLEEAALSYPTPEPSPPTYVAEDLPSETPQSTSMVSNSLKRRQSSLDFSEYEIEEVSAPHRKRAKHVSTPATASVSNTTPPLHYSGRQSVENPTEGGSFNIVPPRPVYPSTVPEFPTRPRKRRLSDGEGQGPAKRPHPAFSLPRLQTVSNPYPTANSDDPRRSPGENPTVEQDLSDNISSLVYTESPISLVPPVLDLQQHDFSLHADLLALQSFNNISAGHLPEQSPLLLFEPLVFPDIVEDAGLEFFECGDLPIDLVTGISPYFGIGQEAFSSSNEGLPSMGKVNLLSLVPGYAPNHPLFYDDSCNNSTNLFPPKISVSGDPKNTDSQDHSIIAAQEARRARAQALREELAQLMVEGL